MSAIALVYIAITPLLEKKYAAKWRYYSWLVIVIGLIIPFRPHIDTAFIQFDVPASQPLGQQIVITGTGEFDLIGQRQLEWYHFACFLWFTGAVTFIIYHCVKHQRFLKIVNRWSEDVTNKQILDTLQRLMGDMGISVQVKLKVCPCISSPMIVNFVNTVILLPSTDFSTDELSFILKHELIHLVRKDLWYRSLVLIATAMHWFNPAVYLMAKAISVQCEISCDEEVVKDAETEGRQKYSATIISVIKSQSRVKTVFSTSFYGGKKGVKKRIFSIMDTGKKKAGVLIFCILFIGTMRTGAVFAIENPSMNNDSSNGFLIKSTVKSITTVIDDNGNIQQNTEEKTYYID